MWFFMLHSGVHATITGVLLAFAIPFGKGDKKSTSYILQHFLHKPVAFIILPIFALTNTAIVFSGDISQTLTENYSLGISFGLINPMLKTVSCDFILEKVVVICSEC